MDLYRDLILVACVLEGIVRLQGKRSLTCFFSYIFLIALAEKVLRLMVPMEHGTNYWFYNLLIIVQIQFFASFYATDPALSKHSRKVWISSLLVAAISTVNFLWFQGMHTVNNISYLLGLSFILLLVALYFRNLISLDHPVNLRSSPLFWLSIGILLFYASCFPYLVFVNAIVSSSEPVLKSLYTLVQIGNMFLSLAYIMVPLCTLTTRRSCKK